MRVNAMMHTLSLPLPLYPLGGSFRSANFAGEASAPRGRGAGRACKSVQFQRRQRCNYPGSNILAPFDPWRHLANFSSTRGLCFAALCYCHSNKLK